MSRILIDLQDITMSRGGESLLENSSFQINSGECILLTGQSGSGKTSLCEAIVGKLYISGTVKNNLSNSINDICYVSQYSTFRDKTGMSQFYYQQRFNSYDADNTVTVLEYLKSNAEVLNSNYDELLELFNFRNKINSSLLYLSSGERKKLQLILSLMNEKPILILDNPFIGLDKLTVSRFYKYLEYLLSKEITIVIVANLFDVPDFVTTIFKIENKKINKINKDQYTLDDGFKTDINFKEQQLLLNYSTSYNTIVELKNVAISYGEKQVIKQVDWLVTGGSKWLLSGENGAGKSTLLSLISGDHPQAYANDIILFDAKRGSGETIWDIKRKIGYVSPELHWNFDRSMSCLEAVVSGFFDTPGLYRRASDEQIKIAQKWMTILQLIDYETKIFANVSSGVQRYLLLARALVKNPPLFIFDEPCQGLDASQTQRFINLIDNLFADSNHTIIYVSHVSDEIPKCITNKLHLVNGLVAYSD